MRRHWLLIVVVFVLTCHILFCRVMKLKIVQMLQVTRSAAFLTPLHIARLLRHRFKVRPDKSVMAGSADGYHQIFRKNPAFLALPQKADKPLRKKASPYGEVGRLPLGAQSFGVNLIVWTAAWFLSLHEVHRIFQKVAFSAWLPLRKLRFRRRQLQWGRTNGIFRNARFDSCLERVLLATQAKKCMKDKSLIHFSLFYPMPSLNNRC